MTRFAAFLRGVNVGRGNRVPMAMWSAQLRTLGYTAVATLLNSGNAVFTAASRPSAFHARRIRAALADGIDIDVPVIVKSAAELAAVMAGNPFADADDPSRLLIGLAADAAVLDDWRDVAPDDARERFHVGEHALYLWCPAGISQSELAKLLLGRRGVNLTTRNWATLTKVNARLNDRP